MAKKKDDNVKDKPVTEGAPAAETTEKQVELTPLEIAEKQAAEFKDMALRARADFENYRKNNLNLASAVRERTLAEVFGEVLNVLDNFDRAEQSIKDNDAKDGVRLIRGQIESLLNHYQVEAYEALGADFDPELHDCIMHVNAPDKVNKVVYEIRRGYKMNGKVLRYAGVAVGSAPEEDAADTSENSSDDKSDNDATNG